MELKELKTELERLAQKPAYTPKDLMNVTRLATMIIQSPRVSDEHKKSFGQRIQAINQKGIENLEIGEIKMVLNLFVQGLSQN